MTAQGALWLAKYLSFNLNFTLLNRISLLLISSCYSVVLTRLGETPSRPVERYSHYRPGRPTGAANARVQIDSAMALGRGRVASPTLGRLYPDESTRYSFYRRLSGSQHQSGQEGVKKNLHPSGSRDRTRAVQCVAKRLAA